MFEKLKTAVRNFLTRRAVRFLHTHTRLRVGTVSSQRLLNDVMHGGVRIGGLVNRSGEIATMRGKYPRVYKNLDRLAAELQVNAMLVGRSFDWVEQEYGITGKPLNPEGDR